MNKHDFLLLNIDDVKAQYPFMIQYFEDIKGTYQDSSLSMKQTLEARTEADLEDFAIDVDATLNAYYHYFMELYQFLGIKEDQKVKSLTILPGYNKDHEKEGFDKLMIETGEIIAIVGPTGSGKSRLLADIEWTAEADTPTGRSIRINQEIPDKKWRFSSGNKLVAQLSQNMNFIMDLSVQEFLELHAASRLIENVDTTVQKIIYEANLLAGESFQLHTPITSLSGGQSRALMIADTAILSESPIVLIDEIENAGIDRKKALKLLVKEEKIVLIATHDPILALMADKRIVIKNGGIAKIITTTDEEKSMLHQLEQVDRYIMEKRNQLRSGETLTKVDMTLSMEGEWTNTSQ